ncbi:nucleotidyltransferase domain-containing protein [Cyanobium sp. NIES-981]|uniref:nucleotidyltransferase family protein n=1 Tax=Cyanobium sp. NIES-981 TaxID=1851505 RepID=UPI001CEDDFAA
MRPCQVFWKPSARWKPAARRAPEPWPPPPRSASDLDLLVDLPAEQSLLGLISLRQDLEDLLGCSVDVTEAESLHPLIRTQILEQALAL